MRRALLLAGALLLAPVLRAQTPDAAPEATPEGVVLGGWSLPAGSVVVQQGYTGWSHDWAPGGDGRTGAGTQHYTFVESTEFHLDVVGDRGPTRVTEHILRAGGAHWESSGSTRSPDVRYDDDTEGQAVVYTAREEVWDAVLAGQRPGEKRPTWLVDRLRPIAVDHAEYLWDRPIRVGETWSLGAELIARGYDDLDATRPQRLVFRLDSVGTWEGHPVAWLSYDMLLHQRTTDWTSRTEMTGTVTRCLDLFLDCLQAGTIVEESEGDVYTESGGTVTRSGPYRGTRRTTFTVRLSVR